MRDPVFIIGGSRTGSEMLKTMLAVSTELDFVDELFLLCPRWLHKDLETNIAEHVGDLRLSGATEKLIDFLYSGVPYGWFWSVVTEQLDKNKLSQRLEGKVLTLQEIFLAIMEVHSTMRGKARTGAKFPMHYSETDVLLKWFPNCQIIHTTRDPRAVYASQATKYLSDSENKLMRSTKKLMQFAHIGIQTRWTASIHERYKTLPNYKLVRYEDVVTDPRNELRQICDFLNVGFEDNMLNPYQYGSSFEKIGKKSGVDKSSLTRWRSAISSKTSCLIQILQKKPMRVFGYIS